MSNIMMLIFISPFYVVIVKIQSDVMKRAISDTSYEYLLLQPTFLRCSKKEAFGGSKAAIFFI